MANAQMTDDELRNELTKRGANAPKTINYKNRSILIKQLNHLRVRKRPKTVNYISRQSNIAVEDEDSGDDLPSLPESWMKHKAPETPSRPRQRGSNLRPSIGSAASETFDTEPSYNTFRERVLSKPPYTTSSIRTSDSFPPLDSSDSDYTSGEEVEMVSRSVNTSTLYTDRSVNSTDNFHKNVDNLRSWRTPASTQPLKPSWFDKLKIWWRSLVSKSVQSPTLRSLSTFTNRSPYASNYSPQTSTYQSPRASFYRSSLTSSRYSLPWFKNWTQSFNTKDLCTPTLSKVLLFIAVVFFLLIASAYIVMSMRSRRSNELSGNWMLCSDEQWKDNPDCLTPVEIQHVKLYLRHIAEVTCSHAGKVDCGYILRARHQNIDEVKTYLKKHLVSSYRESILSNALNIILLNPAWDLRLLGQDLEIVDSVNEVDYIESLRPIKPLSCRVYFILAGLLWIVFLLLIGAVMVAFVYLSFWWCLLRRRRHIQHVQQMAEKIIDVLEHHHEACEKNPTLDNCLAIPLVRDTIIPLKHRENLQRVWDDAVRFLASNDSRVRHDIRKVDGEDFPVWRWVSPSTPSKVWQGQAFGEQSSMMSRYHPTPCLKIRNMFDPDVEYGSDWQMTIQDAILEKCGSDHGILHIAIDKMSDEGCVYVKCKDCGAAGRAYERLHGWWFDKQLVTVRYLRLERYHERFPDSVNATMEMSPSNNRRWSVSYPFFKSVTERT